MRAFAVLIALLVVGCSDDGGADPASSQGETDSGLTGGAGTTGGGGTTAPTASQTSGSTGSQDASSGPVSATTPDPSTDPTNSGGTGSTSEGSESSGFDTSSTGPGEPEPQAAVTEVTYQQGGLTETVTLDDCTFCDATLMAPDLLLLRYQQAEGWTIWSLYIPLEATTETLPLTTDFSGAYMNLSENSPEVTASLHGYFDPTMASGSVTLTEANLVAGGRVAGTIVAELTSGDVTASFASEFYAEIP